ALDDVAVVSVLLASVWFLQANVNAAISARGKIEMCFMAMRTPFNAPLALHEKFQQRPLQQLLEGGGEALVLIGAVVELGRDPEQAFWRARPLHDRHFDRELMEQSLLQRIDHQR